MSYLQPVEDLLRSDAIKYHSADGTSELYGATGGVQEILHLVGYSWAGWQGSRCVANGIGGNAINDHL